MKETVIMRDPINRESWEMVFDNEEARIKYLEKHPDYFIQEFVRYEIEYKPYTVWQLVAYITIGSVIGWGIGMGIIYGALWISEHVKVVIV